MHFWVSNEIRHKRFCVFNGCVGSDLGSDTRTFGYLIMCPIYSDPSSYHSHSKSKSVTNHFWPGPTSVTRAHLSGRVQNVSDPTSDPTHFKGSWGSNGRNQFFSHALFQNKWLVCVWSNLGSDTFWCLFLTWVFVTDLWSQQAAFCCVNFIRSHNFKQSCHIPICNCIKVIKPNLSVSCNIRHNL